MVHSSGPLGFSSPRWTVLAGIVSNVTACKCRQIEPLKELPMKYMLKIDAFVLMIIAAGCVGAAIFAPPNSSELLLIGVIAMTLSSAIMELDRRLGVLESKTDDGTTGPD
jgi:hypothetical protein